MNNTYNYKNLKNEFPREVVERLLLEDGYTYRELQELYKYNERLWSKLAKEYNIPKQTKNIAKNCNKNKKVVIDEVLLLKLYQEEKHSLRQLANAFNCSRDVIKKYLENLNIEIRPFNDKNYYSNRNKAKKVVAHIDFNGYVMLASDRQHRLVMEQYLGRTLTPEEHVHHIDFDKTNNDINNLFLFENDKVHLSYHGYIKKHEYISPEDFLYKVYPKIEYYKTKEFLYEQYVVLNKSIMQISKDINEYVNRTTISQLLKKYGYFEKDKHINQYSI